MNILNLIFFFCYFFSLSTALRWGRTGYSVTTDTVISMMDIKLMPEIDVSAGVQVVIIRNTDTFEKGIKIYCHVEGYNKNKEIKFYFCKGSSECFGVSEGTTFTVTHFNFNIQFNTSIPNKKGLEIWLKSTDKDNDFSGGYFCKATNDIFEIRSNIIEIRDKIYWGPNLFLNIVEQIKTNVQFVNTSSLPLMLNCSNGLSKRNPAAPMWTKIEYVNPVQWSVCPVFNNQEKLNSRLRMTLHRCLQFTKRKCDNTIDNEICPHELNKVTWGTTYIIQNGDLVFTSLKSYTHTKIKSFAFMCYTAFKNEGIKPLFYYLGSISDQTITKGITFDGINNKINNPLKVLSPMKQEFVIYARKITSDMPTSSIKIVAIYAFYKSSSDSTFKWTFRGVELNSNNIIKFNKYMVTFHHDITWEHAGKYVLLINDRSMRIEMEINVKVMGPPITKQENCLIPVLYVLQGDSHYFTCEYKQYPTDIKLQINGQEIKLSDSLDNSKANLKKSYPYLELLDFKLESTNPGDSDFSVTYKVFNLTKTIGHLKYQDHTLTFLVSNDFGSSVKTSSIYVVPRLKSIVTYFPEGDNCTIPCSSSESHKFRCEVRVEEYNNKELIVEYYWTINANKLGDQTLKHLFTPYFVVDPVTKVLTMLPIKSNDTANDKAVKKALENNYIECNINLSPVNREESSFLYKSTADKSLGVSMRSKITLDYSAVDSAYIYWIIAVILGIIVLIILIVLLTRYCVKNRGQSYPLDKLEREHGYDPEKEVQEELFKPYERQEHSGDTISSVGNERRLSITGNSVGSYEDGELDVYDLDPSNFNEDGSIIGKYGVSPRGRAVNS